MSSILYVGMDVHTTNYTLCCYSMEDNRVFAEIQIKPDYREVLKYLDRVRARHGGDCRFLCGYEAGCLGYTLYHQLTDHGVECVILAPSTMPVTPGKHVKNDRMDTRRISRCLAYHTYSAVYVPTEEDNAVKEYIRMREDMKTELKRIKQQTIAFCTRNGHLYSESSYWTKKHLEWLHRPDLGNELLNETLWEYLIRYDQAVEKVGRYDKRIEELAQAEAYREPVQNLQCFVGIATHTALSLCAPEVVAYADRANERLKRKLYRIALRSKHNIAKMAVARELACFVWGMMTGNIA